MVHRPSFITSAVGGVIVLMALAAAVVAWGGDLRSREAPLSNTFGSPEAVAAAVVSAMRAGDLDRLRALALTEEEFRTHVWPGLPASRAGGHVPFEFVWDRLEQRSAASLRQTMAAVKERPLDVRAVRFAGDATPYGSVTVHRRTEVFTSSGDAPLRLFGSMIEQHGTWKVFSYVLE